MSCNSCSNITLPGVAGPTGAAGTDGDDGTDGIFGGYSLEWEFDDNTSASPATTKIRLNNIPSAYALVTEIYIHENNIDSVDSTAFLASFDDTGDVNNHGYIKLFKQHDSTKFWLGKVKSVTDNGSDFTVDVEYILHNGAFAALDDVVVSFVANGADGANGATKSGAIYNYSILDDGDNKSGTSFQLMNTFPIPANTFETNMDEVSLKGGFSGLSSVNFEPGHYVFKVEIDGQDVMDTLYGYNEGTFVAQYSAPANAFEMKFYRTASNKLRPVILYRNIYFGQGVEENNISASDIWAGNLLPHNGDFWYPNISNLSLPEITCPTAFTSALTVNIYMKATTPDLGGDLKIPAFRVMNLHSSYNKI